MLVQRKPEVTLIILDNSVKGQENPGTPKENKFQPSPEIKAHLTLTTPISTVYSSEFPVCQTSVDLVFLLDNSGSVGETNFRKVKHFVKSVIDFFNIGANDTHVSVVKYDTDTHIEFNLVKYFKKNELRNAVDDIEYLGFLTFTGEALDTVRQRVFTASAGMRTNAGKF